MNRIFIECDGSHLAIKFETVEECEQALKLIGRAIDENGSFKAAVTALSTILKELINEQTKSSD